MKNHLFVNFDFLGSLFLMFVKMVTNTCCTLPKQKCMSVS
jgi:hypothetical protein